MRAQRIKLNLVPGGVIPVVNVSQYDVGRPLEFAIYDGPTVATIESGTVIDIRATKPDGTGFEYACTWSNNVVSIATQVQMTVLAGSIECELHLVKDSQEIGTANFILEVEHAALRGDTDVSETELPDIIDLARSHEQAAAASETAAATSATAAAGSASAAATSETNAAASESAAATSATAAAGSASAAATSETNAAASESAAATSATAAAGSASAAATNKSDAEAYAVGKRNGVDVPSSDVAYNNNAKHYAEVAEQAAVGGIIPQGTTTFAQLPALANERVGYMWNISDDFVTTADFREGAGVRYGAGSNVYKTGDGHWDVLSGQVVTGVKGNNESGYRHGDVNIEYQNLGINQIATGGTGANTEAGARQNFFGEDLSSLVQYVIGITASWAKGGYLTLQQLRNKLGLGNTLGALPIANGGTGASTAEGAFLNLGYNTNGNVYESGWVTFSDSWVNRNFSISNVPKGKYIIVAAVRLAANVKLCIMSEIPAGNRSMNVSVETTYDEYGNCGVIGSFNQASAGTATIQYATYSRSSGGMGRIRLIRIA